jgi:hypothetical protein
MLKVIEELKEASEYLGNVSERKAVEHLVIPVTWNSTEGPWTLTWVPV